MASRVGNKFGKVQTKINKIRKEKNKKKPMKKTTFAFYFKKVLQEIEKNKSDYTIKLISSKAISVLDSLVYDLIERLATHAARVAKYQDKVTIGFRDIRTATKILLNYKLAKHAVAEANVALDKYMTTPRK